MLFGIIKRLEDFERAARVADGVELRLDCFEKIELDKLKAVVESATIPILFTARDRLEELFALKPSYFDVPYGTDLALLEKMSSLHPEVKIICSYHNFESTPVDLGEILARMQAPLFCTYKLATMAQSTLDSLRMLEFIKEKKIIGICMGEKGQITRILGKIFGSMMSFAALDADSLTAPGQFTMSELEDIYHYRQLNHATAVYGLIGNPVSKSIGHFAHNAAIRELKINAVYVKMQILKEELKEFFTFAKKLGFRGLSVTMPLKEYVIPYLNEIHPDAKEMGAVNTLLFEGNKLMGFNTDGKGALDALESRGSIKGKKVIILGAGGAAKAIAYTARQRGAEVIILNRTPKEDIEGLEKMQTYFTNGYDVLINCTATYLPIDPQYVIPSSLVMDIKTLPQKDSLLSYGRPVFGHEMWVNQALAQEEIWFKATAEEILSHEMAKHL